MKNTITLLFLLTFSTLFSQQTVECWGVYEISFKVNTLSANPFVGVKFFAEFTQGDKIFTPEGFYDGNETYRLRFMPCNEGKWTYKTISNIAELNAKEGSFICTPATADNHGQVGIKNSYHFQYQDGTPYFPFGTTIYEWAFQPDFRKQQTIESLKNAPFNKVRMLAVPPYRKSYESGDYALTHFPYDGKLPNLWDFSRFDPVYFQQLEKDISKLLDLNIETDLIIFRPYDKGKWGFDTMTEECNIQFIRYLVARFAAYRNIWWSLANENSFIRHLTDEDWDVLFQTVEKYDPYAHLRSIHNADRIYDYKKPWVTHVSLQFYGAVKVPGVSQLLHDQYDKPVIHDEINYEGNIRSRWGQLSGEEMTRRFWNAYICGAYATHGHTTAAMPTDDGWISGGGVLGGTSPARIAFLRKIVEQHGGLNALDPHFVTNLAGKYGEFYIFYFEDKIQKSWEVKLPDDRLQNGMTFKAEIIDTWNMTITPVKEVFTMKKLDNYNFVDEKNRSIKLPQKPYLAIRLTKIE
ncbi:MAG: DUF5060 domain-containing protein [Paludibacter sp.]|nr:DUF5060 domain-containing protein [Paludibacter sp.]